ncbi:MAG: tRNA (adenosine(37)-N6)-dimethylallyltransferase MiaA [Syntrophothermus sp.]
MEKRGESLPRLLAIVGPTGVGKSDFGVELALRYDGEVISADSMQVYRGMDIGTAKLSREEMRGVPHHLIDLVDPDQEFSVAEYHKYATEAVDAVLAKGRLPVLVGGTGLYVRTLVEDMLFPDPGADWELRKKLEAEAAQHGNAYLHGRLAQVDPEAAAKLHPNDLRRVIRALEVYTRTGAPISVLQAASRNKPAKYDLLIIGLTCDRQELYRRIDLRVDRMIAAGLVDEVRALLERYPPGLTAMQALGYKEIAGYLDGRYSLDDAIELLKRETRRYAKRQYTWFRRDKRVIWVDLGSFSTKAEAFRYLTQIIEGRWRDLANRSRLDDQTVKSLN